MTSLLALLSAIAALSITRGDAYAQDCGANEQICVRFHEVIYENGAALPRDALDRPFVVPGARLRVKLQVDFKNPGTQTPYPNARITLDPGLYAIGTGLPLYDTATWDFNCVAEPPLVFPAANARWDSRCEFTPKGGTFIARGNNGVDAQLFEVFLITQNWLPPDGHLFELRATASADGVDPSPPPAQTIVVFDGVANAEARYTGTNYTGEVLYDLGGGQRKYKRYVVYGRLYNTMTLGSGTCASNALVARTASIEMAFPEFMSPIGVTDETTYEHYPDAPANLASWWKLLDFQLNPALGPVTLTMANDGQSPTDLGVSQNQRDWNWLYSGGYGCWSPWVGTEVLIDCAYIDDGLYRADTSQNPAHCADPSHPDTPTKCYVPNNIAPFNAKGWRFDMVPPEGGGTAEGPVFWSADGQARVWSDAESSSLSPVESEREYWPYQLFAGLASTPGVSSCEPQPSPGTGKSTNRIPSQSTLSIPRVSNGDPRWTITVYPPAGIFRAERFALVDFLPPWGTFSFTATYPRVISSGGDVDAELFLCKLPRTFVPAPAPSVPPVVPNTNAGAPSAHHFNPDAQVVIDGSTYTLEPESFDPDAPPWVWNPDTQTGCYKANSNTPNVASGTTYKAYSAPSVPAFPPSAATHFVLYDAVWENKSDPAAQLRHFGFEYTTDYLEFPGELTPTDDYDLYNGDQVEVVWTRNIARLGGGWFDANNDGTIDPEDPEDLAMCQIQGQSNSEGCTWTVQADQHFDNRVRLFSRGSVAPTTVSYTLADTGTPAYVSCGVNEDTYLGRELEGLELTLRLHEGFEPTPITGSPPNPLNNTSASPLHESSLSVLQSDASAASRRVETLPPEVAVAVNWFKPNDIVTTAEDLRVASVWPPSGEANFDPAKTYVHRALEDGRWTYRLRLPQSSLTRYTNGSPFRPLIVGVKPKPNAQFPFVENTDYMQTCEARAYNAAAPESPDVPYSRVSTSNVPTRVAVTGNLALGREPACDSTTSRPAFEFPILNTGGVNEVEVIATVTLPTTTSPVVQNGPTRAILLRAMTLLSNPSTSAPALELTLSASPTAWISYEPTSAWEGQAVHSVRVRYPANSRFPAYSEGRFRLDFDVPGVELEDLGATISAGATIDSQRILPADVLPGSPVILGECPAYLTVEKRFDAADGPLLDAWPISTALTPSQLESAPENPGDTLFTAGGRVTFPVYPSQVVTLTETLPSNTSGPRWTAISTPTGFQMGFANQTRMFINTCACDDGYTCAAADVCRLVDPTAPVADQAVCDYGAPLGAEPSATPIGCDPDDVTALVTDAEGAVVGSIRCRVLEGAMTCDTNPDGTLTIHTDRLECN